VAVVDDVLGGEDTIAGSQQGAAAPAMALGDPPPGGVGSSGIGDAGRPVTGQNRAVRGTPRSEAGGDGLGSGDPLRTDQHPGWLAEQAGPVVHRVDDVAVGTAHLPVGLAQGPDEFSAAPAENGTLRRSQSAAMSMANRLVGTVVARSGPALSSRPARRAVG
jgi:hypothetical protein